MSGVKRATAIRHLVEIAETANGRRRLLEPSFNWPLDALWVAGDVLSDDTDVESMTVIMSLDLPAEEVPWLALNASGEWIGEDLGLPKRPTLWCYRPAAWPAWNHQSRRVARFWSETGGPDESAIGAMQARQLEKVAVIEPTVDELVAQLRMELPISEEHLRHVVAQYWERDWRRQHQGYGIHPEDHLWRAAAAVAQMHDALEQIQV